MKIDFHRHTKSVKQGKIKNINMRVTKKIFR